MNPIPESNKASREQIADEIDRVLAECPYDGLSVAIYRDNVIRFVMEIGPAVFTLRKTGELLRKTYRVSPAVASWLGALEHVDSMAADGYAFGY